jgi:hypothetical protein
LRRLEYALVYGYTVASKPQVEYLEDFSDVPFVRLVVGKIRQPDHCVAPIP